MADEVKPSVKRDGTVMLGATCIGRVESRESTKTGFKRGYSIGQVPCTRYVAWDAQGRQRRRERFNAEWPTRRGAVAALVEAHHKANP